MEWLAGGSENISLTSVWPECVADHVSYVVSVLRICGHLPNIFLYRPMIFLFSLLISTQTWH